MNKRDFILYNNLDYIDDVMLITLATISTSFITISLLAN